MSLFKHTITLICVSLCLSGAAQNKSQEPKWFIGIGNTNIIADIVTLSDKSFLGEISGQLRGGFRFYDKYEFNVGTYFRNYPRIKNYPGLSYNKFLGFSGAFMYEFRKPQKKWGMPLGIEVVKHKRHLDSALGTNNVYYDHFQAISFGPKIGARYHFSKNFFVETELEILYEHFKLDTQWNETEKYESNRFSSLKLFGLSANYRF